MNTEFKNTLNPKQLEEYNKLSKVNQVLYKYEFKFYTEYVNATDIAGAHAAGLKKVGAIAKLAEEESKPKTHINLKTGRKTICTEAELMARHQF